MLGTACPLNVRSGIGYFFTSNQKATKMNRGQFLSFLFWIIAYTLKCVN